MEKLLHSQSSGRSHNPGLRRIAMNIAQLFHKLRVISNIEIVVSALPEMLIPTRLCNQTPRHSLLQRFQRIGQRIPLRFAEQQVHMLQHHYIPVNLKLESVPHALQG